MNIMQGTIPNDIPNKAPTPDPENIAATFWLKIVGLKNFQTVKARANRKSNERAIKKICPRDPRGESK